MQADLLGLSRYTRQQENIEWESAMGRDYLIEISNDGISWSLVKTVLHNTEHTGLESYGRYVRVRGTQRASIWGYSIFEFKVYGEQAQ